MGQGIQISCLMWMRVQLKFRANFENVPLEERKNADK